MNPNIDKLRLYLLRIKLEMVLFVALDWASRWVAYWCKQAHWKPLPYRTMLRLAREDRRKNLHLVYDYRDWHGAMSVKQYKVVVDEMFG